MKKLVAEFEAGGGKWSNFKVGDLFDIHPTSSYKMTNVDLFKTKGNTPVVTNSSVNNGITGYVNLAPTEKGGIITYSDTTTSEAIFYQPDNFVGYSHVQGLYPYDKKLWNEKTLLYFVSLFRKSANNRFDYANKFNRTVASEMFVKLPISSENKIDFNFMENYIRELEQERIRELERYLQASGLDNYELTGEERKAIDLINSNKIKFKDFIIKDIFDIATGKDFIIGNSEKGSIPLVSHTNSDNGISIYVKQQKNKRLFNAKNTLALADRGVFYATTQDKNFHIGTRVKALTFKSGEMSEEKRLFFTTTINKLQIFFTEYLINATDSLPDLKIKLPINYEGEIDYEFMNTYMKAIEKLVIKNVVDWKNKIINTTKAICNK